MILVEVAALGCHLAQDDGKIMLQASLCDKRQLARSTRMDAASHCLGRAFRLPFCSFARHGLMSGCIQSFPPKKAAARKNSGG
jgi:hypothetical protein